MTSARRVLDALADRSGSEGSSYAIRLEVNGCFFGHGPDGQAVLLIPILEPTSIPGRALEGLGLDFRDRVRFVFENKSWESPAAVLECTNGLLLKTFCALGADFADRLQPSSRSVTAKEVIASVREWETLLRQPNEISEATAIGLWGELIFLNAFHDVELGVKSWRGPRGEQVDFLCASSGFECKTSRARLKHFISQSQLTSPSSTPTYVVSLHAEPDPADGRSVLDLVSALDSKISNSSEWEKLLLETGFRRLVHDAFLVKYRLASAPSVFRERDIPRVRQIDVGVAQLRYAIELDETLELIGEERDLAITRIVNI